MLKKLLLLILFITLVSSICTLAFARTIFTDVTKESGLRDIMKMDSAPIWGDYDMVI